MGILSGFDCRLDALSSSMDAGTLVGDPVENTTGYTRPDGTTGLAAMGGLRGSTINFEQEGGFSRPLFFWIQASFPGLEGRACF